MSDWIKLKASDGHELSAYVARPKGEPIGALVLVQEIFGVNAHIRSVADGYAKDGFLVVAPAIFDRFERGLELTYGPEDMKRAFEIYPSLKPEITLLDVAAAYERGEGGRQGNRRARFLLWRAGERGWPRRAERTTRCGLRAALAYYPGGIGRVAKEEPSCPVMLNFGAEDAHIGKDQIEAVRTAHPEVEIFIYEGAGHAFNRDADPNSYHAASAKLAGNGRLAFLKNHIA